VSRLRIRHETTFRYEAEVVASYNELRMRPMMSDRQFVLTEHVMVTPLTSQQNFIDYWGTRVTSVEILQPHDSLNVIAESLVEIFPAQESGPELTWDELRAATSTSMGLTEILVNSPLTKPPKDLASFAKKEAAKHSSPADAARAISAYITSKMTYQFGVTEVHSTAAEAWKEKKGVCQDITHLVLGALRSVGIPARYVSGYLHPSLDAVVGETVRGESHAWVEWFAGSFVGHDPTNDRDISNRHVIVGRGRDYTDVPPIRGVYDGPKTSEHRVDVHLTLER
jgi:transglutaminase-like putative cysteine protease